MEIEDIELLCSQEFREEIAKNILRKPTNIALDKHIVHHAMVASQVKELQRAKTKLPSYYSVQAILPPLSYEQSSSQKCAEHKKLSGKTLLDLTCGLGVDSAILASKFEKVVSVEYNQVTAMVAHENFKRLGLKNIEVVNCSAEEYLNNCNSHFDWVICDPDRRNESGKKLVCLEDCKPDVVALRDKIKAVADRIFIKCSPLFDVEVALQYYPNCSVEVVSLGGECKEVNIIIDGSKPTLSAVALDIGEYSSAVGSAKMWSGEPKQWNDYKYIIIPDVALAHARLVSQAFCGIADVWSDKGVGLATTLPPKGLPIQTYKIISIEEFNTKELKKRFKGSKIEIWRRDFRWSNAQICNMIGVKEGGTNRYLFTRLYDKDVVINFEPI